MVACVKLVPIQLSKPVVPSGNGIDGSGRIKDDRTRRIIITGQVARAAKGKVVPSGRRVDRNAVLDITSVNVNSGKLIGSNRQVGHGHGITIGGAYHDHLGVGGAVDGVDHGWCTALNEGGEGAVSTGQTSGVSDDVRIVF